MRQLEAQTGRWEHMDATATVDALTRDQVLATLYTQTLDEHDDSTARVLVSTAVQAIVDKASTARTGIGKRRTLERARAILEERASDRSGSPRPEDARLASWSDAIYCGLCAATQSGFNDKKRV